jgi:anaerobic selenocysteine-containing dehydrogenase
MGAVNWPGGAHISHAVFCLNALVGSIDVPGGVIYQVHPKYREMGDGAPDEIARSAKIQPCLDFRGTDRFPMAKVVTNQIPESILEDAPYPAEMAIGFNSNFNMFAPGTQRWDKALSKLPYFVHISPFISEMAMYADLVLPSTTYLEEWGYDHSLAASGSPEARIKQPVVTARGESRSAIDILFELARRLGGRIAQSFSDLGGDSKGFVQFRTATLKPWEEFLRDGVWSGPDYQYKKYQHLFNTPSKKFEFCSGNFKALMSKMKRRTGDLDGLPRYEEPQFLGQREKYPLILLPYQPLMVIENGSQNYPWAQEIFLPMQGVGWENLAEINSETANTLNLRDGEEVWIESPFQRMKLKVKCSEGVHPEVVAVSIGQGHSAYGRWQKGMGVNPNEILGVDYDTLSGQSVFFNTRVRVYKA